MHIRSVLLVDDDPDIRLVVQMSLADVGGWEVELAASGAEALAKVGRFNPDIILLDVMMPDMDGPTTYAELREIAESADTPVIFLTAKVQQQEVERYMALGAAGYISKPFNPMTLPREICTITKDL